MDEATNGHHCRGTKIIPFSMHNVDEVLGDLDLNITRSARLALAQPGRPAAYAGVVPRLVERLGTEEPVTSPAEPVAQA